MAEANIACYCKVLISACFLPVIEYFLISACAQITIIIIKTTVIFIIRSMFYMARINLIINLFSDSQLHEIGYTQHFDAPLRWVQTIDLDFEASLAKEVSNFSMVFFQRWLMIILPWTVTELIPRIVAFTTSLLDLWLSAWTCWQWAGPKLHFLLSAHPSNRRMFPYHRVISAFAY